jgi:hypothetical protein
MMNYVKFDMNKLSSVKTVKAVSFSAFLKTSNMNADDLFLK